MPHLRGHRTNVHDLQGLLCLQVIRAFEFYTGKRSGRMYKFDVLITTFELVLKDAAMLSEIKWSYLVVDEAHRLKNNESALYRVCGWGHLSYLSVVEMEVHGNHALKYSRCYFESVQAFAVMLQELATWQFKNKLLVTGTPLQNSMKELWALLHFLEPQKFPNAEDFDARHSLKKAEEVCVSLQHKLPFKLDPHTCPMYLLPWRFPG